MIRSLPNTDPCTRVYVFAVAFVYMQFMQVYYVGPRCVLPLGYRGGHYRDITTPGEDVMIFWTQLGLFRHTFNKNVATFGGGAERFHLSDDGPFFFDRIALTNIRFICRLIGTGELLPNVW